MASAAHAALLRAIEGYKGSTAGSKEHEELNAHLSRVYELATRGRKDPADDSPGRREAARAAFQKEIPDPREESGGNVRSNDEHGFNREYAGKGDPGVIAPEHNAEPRIVSRAAGVPTQGNRFSNAASGGYPEGTGSFRTVAAERAVGDKMHTVPPRDGGSNVKSNPPGSREPEGGQIGNVSAPAKAGPNRATGDWEKVPGYVAKERMGADPWERAQEGVRKLLKAPRR